MKESLPRIRAGWFVVGPPRVASARYQGYMIVDHFKSSETVDAEILYKPKSFSPDIRWQDFSSLLRYITSQKLNVVVFQKVAGIFSVALMRELQKRGIFVIFVDCDYRRFYPFARFVTAFGAPSLALVERIRKVTGKPCYYLPDPIEHEMQSFLQPAPIKTQKLRLVWVGGRDNFHQIEKFQSSLSTPIRSRIEITTISNHSKSRIVWKSEDFPNILRNFDAAVLPVSQERWSLMKSPNRALLFLGAGLPLFVQRSEIYKAVARDLETAIVFEDPLEFETRLDEIYDESLRAKIVENGFVEARAFRLQTIACEWEKMLHEVVYA